MYKIIAKCYHKYIPTCTVYMFIKYIRLIWYSEWNWTERRQSTSICTIFTLKYFMFPSLEKQISSSSSFQVCMLRDWHIGIVDVSFGLHFVHQMVLQLSFIFIKNLYKIYLELWSEPQFFSIAQWYQKVTNEWCCEYFTTTGVGWCYTYYDSNACWMSFGYVCRCS